MLYPYWNEKDFGRKSIGSQPEKRRRRHQHKITACSRWYLPRQEVCKRPRHTYNGTVTQIILLSKGNRYLGSVIEGFEDPD